MLIRITLAFIMLAVCAGVASAQATTGKADPYPQRPKPGPTPNIYSAETMVEEMKVKAALKSAEKAHEENLGRAREAAQIGSELHAAFSRNKGLGGADFKKLERLEKLIRRIRGAAGGSDDDDEVVETPSGGLEKTLELVEERTRELREVVEKTPRQVVSARVIERTNELLEMIRSMRGANTR